MAPFSFLRYNYLTTEYMGLRVVIVTCVKYSTYPLNGRARTVPRHKVVPMICIPFCARSLVAGSLRFPTGGGCHFYWYWAKKAFTSEAPGTELAPPTRVTAMAPHALAKRNASALELPLRLYS
jgi:hypothetical protein